jgi:hypothetical protein
MKVETEYLCERRVLRKIFGPKTEVLIGGWKKLYHDKIYALFFSPDIMAIESRRMRYSVMWDARDMDTVF